MKIKIIFILTVIISGCGTTSKRVTYNPIPENNKDVFILSILLQDQLRKTHDICLDLDDLVQMDSLKRISNNFETIEVQYLGGYIAVYYKFSSIRNSAQIELNKIELEEIGNLNWLVKDFKEPFDGKIQYEYGERFYGIRKITTK